MHIGELPMIIFTTVAQMSVGAFWILGIIQFIGRWTGMRHVTIDRITNAGMYAAGPLLVLGFFAAFFHLNDPMHSPYTLFNMGSSWLSRELISGVLYAALGALFAITQWFDLFSRKVRDVLAILTALAGLALLVSMCGVYYFTETVPAWHSWFTWVSFFCSAFFTGALAVAVALFAAWSVQNKRDGNPTPLVSGSQIQEEDVAKGKITKEQWREYKATGTTDGKGDSVSTFRKATGLISRGLFPEGRMTIEMVSLTQRSLRMAASVAAVAGAILLVAYPFHMTGLGLGSEVERQVAHAMMDHGYLAIRLITLALAVLLIALVLRKQLEKATSPSTLLVVLLAVAFILAIATELLGRGLHYEGLIRAGINTTMG
ncbi:dimethyl sulfoxide reductase anchor subunit [Winkia sp. UMB3158]|uniref:dimethyl sulfoxide reductase anchor subunit family protein n=1 Tax=unclassified Winkia TaxID=2692119 RepID=UPI002553A660|nr:MULTISPECIES: DmsC/YnfH family molybdoenzyme membrane anchor subunit [unclassified Winkia]MDK7150016.1 dimethyl sulfoxide reductase anchor subunit [Winkia sp. UMB3158]MDK8341031.1 dimethyl sulfoxide reductase anchor subunit [Winkia sp. UMB3164B]MDK8565480.1 dimethyl sulfoxide reductase anchor subunit [Winkia sp. UMB3164A]